MDTPPLMRWTNYQQWFKNDYEARAQVIVDAQFRRQTGVKCYIAQKRIKGYLNGQSAVALFFFVDFKQPAGRSRLKQATVQLEFSGDCLGCVTEYIAPRGLSGPLLDPQSATRMQIIPRVQVLGIGGLDGVGWEKQKKLPKDSWILIGETERVPSKSVDTSAKWTWRSNPVAVKDWSRRCMLASIIETNGQTGPLCVTCKADVDLGSWWRNIIGHAEKPISVDSYESTVQPPGFSSWFRSLDNLAASLYRDQLEEENNNNLELKVITGA